MALFGNASFGSLFGAGGAQSTFSTPVIGVSESLLQASFNADLTRLGLQNLSPADRAAFNRGTSEDAFILPPGFGGAEETEDTTLNERVREVRAKTTFIDTDSRFIESVENDIDRQATFVLFQALTDLRTLAEFAADDRTSEASLERIDEQFQQGFAEVQNYLLETQTDRLDLFLGEKTDDVETAIRTGRNGTVTEGSGVVGNRTDVVSGLTGTEVFTVTISKAGETDNITVDLSGISGDLTLENIAAHINTQIEALTDTNDEGEEFIKHQTRFSVSEDSNGRFGLQVDGTITEAVTLSAASAEPTLYVASSVSQIDDSFATTARVTQVNGLSGTLVRDDSFTFAGIDLAATELNELTADAEEDDVDEDIAALRDQFRADALADVTTNSTSNDDDNTSDNSASITNVDSEFVENANTFGNRVATTSDGGIFVVGTTQGSFGHQINTSGTQDVYLTRFDSEGSELFSRLLGAADSADVFDITVDANDNVIITGQTNGELAQGDVIDSEEGDAFVAKFNENGDEVFRYQLDTFAETSGQTVAVDSNGDIFVGGFTRSPIGVGSTFAGGEDALVLKLNGTTGALQDSHVFGTSGNDVVKGIAVDANDNVVLAVEEGANAVVYRIDGSNLSSQTDSVNFGNLGLGGSIESLTIDNTNGEVYLAGTTNGGSLNASGAATVNGAQSTGFDGFVSGATLSGSTNLSANFTTYLSTTGTDTIADVVVNNGNVYVAGSTNAEFAGEDDRGATDAFVARLDGASGTVSDIEQFGEGLARTNVGGLAFTAQGDSVLETLGLPVGDISIDETLDIETQTSATEGDHFFISFDGGRRREIDLDEGDTLDDIARKIRIAGFGQVEVNVSSSLEGDRLQIEALSDGVSVDLIAGAEGEDLLGHLGLEPGRLLPRDEIFDLNDDDDRPFDPETDLGGVFGLGLEGALHIRDRATANYVLNLLDSAIGTTQRAFRSLEFNQFRDLLNRPGASGGTVSQATQNQLANLQSGLARLQAGSPAGSSLSLFA
ncbi:beta strand repeat-containing protein [Kordiimonas laminariae]|uniref:beta strand repeat-containing protein n=1 Tax=Kordiimonas laminariae TaxID=2917717 RepID=UPI001FF3FA83|nr:hypothetical protein [Kordiimonas laminariae]MCK0069964.1 hypothetical protein [Kordiimonas laminariae]